VVQEGQEKLSSSSFLGATIKEAQKAAELCPDADSRFTGQENDTCRQRNQDNLLQKTVNMDGTVRANIKPRYVGGYHFKKRPAIRGVDRRGGQEYPDK
jgi:hypothetical protein